MLKTAIPFVDLRGRTPVDLLRSYPDKATTLINAMRRIYGPLSYGASALVLPLADKASYAWLKKTWNPYLYEIECFAEILENPGIYAVNLCYEWGCTGGVYRTDDSLTLLRVLDWPVPDLGRQVMVVLQQGKAGEFYNLTWPGVSGVYTAMAPGRFCGAINMAPMRMHGLGLVGDWLKNRLIMRSQLGLPPSHLLRQAFEKAATYEEAKHMLVNTQLAAPVIYILAGTEPGEGCIIERLENSAEVIELAAGLSVSAANHFNSKLAAAGKGWRPREIDSQGRYRQSCTMQGYDLRSEHFNWMTMPMLNRYTRLCVIADASTGRLMAQGFEGQAQVTNVFSLLMKSGARRGAM